MIFIFSFDCLTDGHCSSDSIRPLYTLPMKSSVNDIWQSQLKFYDFTARISLRLPSNYRLVWRIMNVMSPDVTCIGLWVIFLHFLMDFALHVFVSQIFFNRFVSVRFLVTRSEICVRVNKNCHVRYEMIVFSDDKYSFREVRRLLILHGSNWFQINIRMGKIELKLTEFINSTRNKWYWGMISRWSR